VSTEAKPKPPEIASMPKKLIQTLRKLSGSSLRATRAGYGALETHVRPIPTAKKARLFTLGSGTCLSSALT
jgi:hypothetical protein